MYAWMIGPSEMDSEMFEATSFAEAMSAAHATFGRYANLIVFGRYALEPSL